MLLVFDTSVIIAIEKEDNNILKKISELSKSYSGPPQITFIIYYEFLMGIKKRSPINQAKAMDLLSNFNCLSATKETAEILSALKYKYDAAGISISLADLIIAAQVKENNMVLVTKDKTFEKIEEINYNFAPVLYEVKSDYLKENNFEVLDCTSV